MFKTIINAWKVKDIRSKILYTLLLIVVYRLGSFIPVPGVDSTALASLISQYDFLSFLDLFSGGSLSQFSIFAMGISPYITASIIMQLLTIAIPALERLSQEDDGREKIEKITRYVGVGLALIQSVSIVVGLSSVSSGTSLLKTVTLFGTSGFGVFMNGFMPYVIVGVCCTAGTAFLMWMGERINEKGIGNGISILIFASIVSSVPQVVINLINGTFHIKPITSGGIIAPAYKWWYALVVIIVVLVLVVGVILVDKAVRKISVQYAKRVVGRKTYGGAATHIPLKANANGVMPLIFAMTILQVPAMIGQFWPKGGFYKFVQTYLSASSTNVAGVIIYYVLYALLIVGFAYFYSSITFNPVEISKNLQQNGGFIPGIRPGRPTADYLKKKCSRLTMFGALFLMIVAIVPTLVLKLFDITVLSSFGPTSILIMVSVSLEIAEQLDSLMLMRNYKGFLG